MRLQDLFSAAYPIRVQTHDGRIHTLKSASEFATNVAAAPIRYVLDDAAVSAISQCAFEDQSMLGDAIDLLRVPADRMWIEWSDRLAVEHLESEGWAVGAKPDRTPRKVGLLIETDETGRSGEVRTTWLGKTGEVELSPFVAEFDFDHPVSNPKEQLKQTVRYIHIDGLESLDPFYACIRYRLEPSWEAYYRAYCESEADYQQTLSSALSYIGGDFPLAATFLLMLSTRTAFAERSTEFSKLNAKRAKKGKTPLLDHVEVRLNLTPSEQTGGFGVGDRSAPRLHHVSGHLVRRGATLYWRKSHLRGNPQRGAITAKTIAVTSTPISKAA